MWAAAGSAEATACRRPWCWRSRHEEEGATTLGPWGCRRPPLPEGAIACTQAGTRVTQPCPDAYGPPACRAVQGDVRSYDSCEKMVAEAVQRFGRWAGRDGRGRGVPGLEVRSCLQQIWPTSSRHGAPSVVHSWQAQQEAQR